MKKLKVSIKLDILVPDDWELVETSEGTTVVTLPDGRYLDLAIDPLFSTDPEQEWASTQYDDVLDEILDMVESEEVTYEFVTH